MDDRFDAPVLHREAGPGQHRGFGPSADVSAEAGDHVIRDGFHADVGGRAISRQRSNPMQFLLWTLLPVATKARVRRVHDLPAKTGWLTVFIWCGSNCIA